MHRPLAILDLRDLRLVQFDPLVSQTTNHVLLGNLGICCQPEAEDRLAGDISSFAFRFHRALEGAPILFLFCLRIIPPQNKTPHVIVNPADAKPQTILCVDDHTLVGDGLHRVFTTAGHAVERAYDGESAWEKISADIDRFDVVIADHQIPRLNGLGVVSRMRAKHFPGRIIVYSGAISDDDTGSYRALEVDAIIVKGPASAQLLAVVEAFHGEY